MRLARLYLCTDARQREGDLADFLEEVFAGGVDIVQIRQPGMELDAELAALEVARTVARRHSRLVCVNDSAELAGRFSADVLHLELTDVHSGPLRGSVQPQRARRHLHQWAQLGRSASTPTQVDAAVADAAVDYFSVGAVYATATKPDSKPVGLELLRYATRLAPPAHLTSKPWFAVGGITADNLDEVLAAGARRICVVRALTQAADPRAAAGVLKQRLAAAWRADPGMQAYTFGAARGGA